MKSAAFTFVLALGLGCTTSDTVSSDSPYSLHCSEAGGRPQCVRFHGGSGAARSIAFENIATGGAEPKSGTGFYELRCGQWLMAGAHDHEAQDQPHPLVCVRLDKGTGQVELIEADKLPKGL